MTRRPKILANLVIVTEVQSALAASGSWAQTVAVYPEMLKSSLRNALAACGVQRIVSLGGATMDPDLATPQDGMELLRRMCKWVVEETPTQATGGCGAVNNAWDGHNIQWSSV
jgi:Acyl-CoA reductase (LuxC)